ncbi:uncharacterized protein EHS24_009000 [Apiotrichum porosum]|uniref:RRM domain-containing protein n=1 Tax=Apiotrichum porosum TaxID=105984 RepID=A0A427XNT2_9TREE|nr:uncharacterized protein EHS24_009000 [Apiotrichum porosum]RSH80422.1 hypothetical protein EHS24_009000 [Apiotrichum porosum]
MSGSSPTFFPDGHFSSNAEVSPSPTPIPATPEMNPFDARRRTIDESEGNGSPASAAESAASSHLSPLASPFAPTQAEEGEEGKEDKEGRREPQVATEAPRGTHVHPNGGAFPTVLQVSDLHWFTVDAELVRIAAAGANVHITVKDVTFLEHKCNGKSKGTAFINCHTPDRLMRLMKWFETHEYQGKRVTVNVANNVNGKPPIPPPTHDKDSGGAVYRTSDEAARGPLPFLPTNSHGGVNFNRVPLHHRQQMQQMQQAGFLNPGATFAKGPKGAAAHHTPAAQHAELARGQSNSASHAQYSVPADHVQVINWHQPPTQTQGEFHPPLYELTSDIRLMNTGVAHGIRL